MGISIYMIIYCSLFFVILTCFHVHVPILDTFPLLLTCFWEATQAAFSCFQAFLKDGDEVVTFAPFFDQYQDQAALAGGRLQTVRLSPAYSQWSFDEKEFEVAFTSKTKVFLLNTVRVVWTPFSRNL